MSVIRVLPWVDLREGRAQKSRDPGIRQERSGRKLSRADVRAIRQMWLSGMRTQEIAKAWGISSSYAYNLVWNGIRDDEREGDRAVRIKTATV